MGSFGPFYNIAIDLEVGLDENIQPDMEGKYM